MQVDIILEYAKVYDIERADILKGQKFILYADYPDGRWFSDNDPVLTLSVDGGMAACEATAVGLATILIMDASFSVLKKLYVNIVEDFVPQAISLGAQAGAAVPK